VDKKYLNFEIENAEIISNDNNSEFLTASIDAFSTGITKNDTICDVEALKKSAPTIYEKPILFTIDERFGDFYTHTEPEKSLVAGFVVPNSATFKENGDKTVLNVQAKIWSRYAKNFVDVFKNGGTHSKKVSVEVNLLDSENENGLLKMKNWIFSGICVLSDLIQEACVGSNIVLNFAEENEKIKKAYILEFGKYENIDFKIPDIVKKNAQEGLDLYKKHGRGGTSITLSNARFFIGNDAITPEKVHYISKYFKNKYNLDDKSSNDYISYQLMGGNEARKWLQGVANEMSAKDDEQSAYFADELTFPYKTRGDMNPSLKGIDPPITASQGEEIAKQAESIGSDKEKNGWAIAISSFKKSHIVKDGKWVKKEESKNMSDEEEKKEFVEEKDEKEKLKEEKEEAKENPKEEEKETKEEEKKEDKKEKFSLDANADAMAMMAMLKSETEKNEGIAKKQDFEVFEANLKEEKFADAVGAMFSFMCKMSERMCKMEEDNKAYMQEFEELKKFKAEKEGEQKTFEVNSTLKKMSEEADIPEEKMSEMRRESEKFSVENINSWKNYCKAIAFDYKKKVKTEEADTVIGYALPWGIPDKTQTKSIWEQV
jgi:hypothetical protein